MLCCEKCSSENAAEYVGEQAIFLLLFRWPFTLYHVRSRLPIYAIVYHIPRRCILSLWRCGSNARFLQCFFNGCAAKAESCTTFSFELNEACRCDTLRGIRISHATHKNATRWYWRNFCKHASSPYKPSITTWLLYTSASNFHFHSDGSLCAPNWTLQTLRYC